jgi:prokaryotic ubiquitin-like protein Pup
MAEQIRKEPSKQKREPEPVAEIPVTETDEEKKAATEALLDEIDEVLEENAEEFVKSYVQKGGQ